MSVWRARIAGGKFRSGRLASKALMVWDMASCRFSGGEVVGVVRITERMR